MTEEEETAQIEDARRIFAGPITFLKSAPQLKHLPDPVAPEVAFAGRSNVSFGDFSRKKRIAPANHRNSRDRVVGVHEGAPVKFTTLSRV